MPNSSPVKRIRIISAPNKNVWYYSKVNQEFDAFVKDSQWWVNGLFPIPIYRAVVISETKDEKSLTKPEKETLDAITQMIDKNNVKPYVYRKDLFEYMNRAYPQPLTSLVKKGFIGKERIGTKVIFYPL